MNRNKMWIIGLIVLGFVGFVFYLCLDFLLAPVSGELLVYDSRYYQQQPKVNGLKFEELNKAAKIEVLFPLAVSDSRLTIEDADGIEFARRFFQSYSDGWVELHEQKSEATGGTMGVHFYDSSNREMVIYLIGPNRLVYEYSYWRYIKDSELMPLLEKLGIQDEYEALYKEPKIK